MDLRKLKTLIDLVAESGIAEIEVTEGEDKVRIVKHGPPPQTVTMSAPATYVAPPPAMPAAVPPPAPVPVAAPADEPKGTVVLLRDAVVAEGDVDVAQAVLPGRFDIGLGAVHADDRLDAHRL